MTKDLIALTPRMPDPLTLLVGLHAGGPGTRATATADGAVVQLLGAGGRPLVSVESPVLVQVPGEVDRLLGPRSAAAAPVPVWWTETRASSAVPEAEPLAGSVVGRLAHLLGGTVWPPGAGGTGVVPVESDPGPDGTEGTTAIVAEDPLPAVDVVTESTVVVLADRPVVPLTAWLAEVLRTTAARGSALQIVTPAHCRLSHHLRTALTGPPNRWVVQHADCGYYDGLTGAVLGWRDGTFAVVPDAAGGSAPAAPYRPAGPTGERQLAVSFRTAYPPEAELLLGRSLELAWRTLTGAPPAGWGTAEPINLPWSPRQLTDLARARMPEPTFVTAVGAPGRPALATVRITRTTAGVEEDVTLTVGHGEGERVPLDAVQDLAAALADGEHGLISLLATLRPARRDLTAPPVFEAPPVPLAFTLGPEGVLETTLTHARRPPLALRPVQLGPEARPALHYPLGDGTHAEAWHALDVLLTHLRRRAAV
ncbi:DUF6177 family protein [Streptomyces sp. NPDC002490]|uniref:DUF6177 family protein n=1 Tax=Streptomyces sp. NPDC002490 TaxID=3154416 RepID=UPI003319113F